jgi:rhodanese-related sulfurtransferase
MVRSITGPDLKAMLDRGEGVVLVDALLPRGVAVVVYSNDASCPASGLVAAKLNSLGFDPVFDYNDSYADWKDRGYPLERHSE